MSDETPFIHDETDDLEGSDGVSVEDLLAFLRAAMADEEGAPADEAGDLAGDPAGVPDSLDASGSVIPAGDVPDRSVTSSVEGDALRFATVAEAENLIERYLRDGGNSGHELRRVADWLLSHDEELSETADDWHTLIGHFIRRDDYRYVYLLAVRALESFSYDPSLLGDALQAAAEGGFWSVGERLVERAERLPKRYWNWYLCTWVCEFYLGLAAAVEPDRRSETIEKGVQVAREYRRQFPLQERIYNQEAEMLIADCRIDEARCVLEDAIYHSHPAIDGTERRISCPQCCATYLDSILEGTNDYERIIDIARRGMKDAATKERSMKVGYFVFREALALDGMIHEEEERSHARGFGNQDLVRQALETYRLAYELRTREGATSNCLTIRERFSILCGKSGITDLKLEE